MRAGLLSRTKGADPKIGCVLDIDFRKVDVAADGYFMDRSVYGHKCQRKLGAHWTASGWEFDGSDDYALVPSGILEGTGAFTVQVLADMTAFPATYAIMLVKRSGATAIDLIALETAGEHYQRLWVTGLTPSTITANKAIAGGQKLYTGIFDGSTFGLYEDQVEDTVSPVAVTGSRDDYAAEIVIGASEVYDQNFGGVIREVTIRIQAEYAARILQRAIWRRRN